MDLLVISEPLKAGQVAKAMSPARVGGQQVSPSQAGGQTFDAISVILKYLQNVNF